MENKSKDVLLHYANAFDDISVNLAELDALLQLYYEHREEELRFLAVEGAGSGAIKAYLSRDCMTDALLSAILTKVQYTRNVVDASGVEAHMGARDPRA